MTSLLALSLLAGSLTALQAAPTPRVPPPTTLQDKAFGVLLLGLGGGRDWQEAMTSMAKAFLPQFPLALWTDSLVASGCAVKPITPTR